MSKPRIAIFDFACCEGCQLQIVNMEEELLEAGADILCLKRDAQRLLVARIERVMH